MEDRHSEALSRIAEADAAWSSKGHPPRTFLVMHLGGMRELIDHPGWDESWPVPATATIDDLEELGLLRVKAHASNSKDRAFTLTLQGREATSSQQAASPAGPADQRAPTAFVSWAHGNEAWQSTVVAFTFSARELGINADIDLLHLHDPCVDWTTYGPRAVQENEFVLIPVSTAYRRRWEGDEVRGEGAGAAREANTLKTLFGDDQQAFRRKVKIVVLPGANTNDIPAELKAVVQRFEIETFDKTGFEDLLRTLTNRPAYVPPPVGSLPLLPPKSAGTKPRADTKYVMADVITQLPARQKLAVALTYYERLTRDEIAEILAVSPNDVSRLVQTAINRLGEAAISDLVADVDRDMGSNHHTANAALLRDGPHEGEYVKIEPGQVALELAERFDFDQGHADVIDHYTYEESLDNAPGTVAFTFSHQEHRVTTDG